MAEKRSAQVQELTVDVASLAGPVPVVAQEQAQDLAELEVMLKRFASRGMVQQRPDGSFVMPGYQDPRQAQIDARGSDCACERCTPNNQFHWYCAGCYSGPNEWVTRQPKGDPIVLLGRAGTSGKSYQFCTPDCGRAFRQRHGGMTPGVMPQLGANLDGIPLAP